MGNSEGISDWRVRPLGRMKAGVGWLLGGRLGALQILRRACLGFIFAMAVLRAHWISGHLFRRHRLRRDEPVSACLACSTEGIGAAACIGSRRVRAAIVVGGGWPLSIVHAMAVFAVRWPSTGRRLAVAGPRRLHTHARLSPIARCFSGRPEGGIRVAGGRGAGLHGVLRWHAACSWCNPPSHMMVMPAALGAARSYRRSRCAVAGAP